MILVDTNVPMEVFTADRRTAGRLRTWTSGHSAVRSSSIQSSTLSSAPASRRFEALDAVIDEAGLRFDEIPRDALFLPGKAYLLYRRRGGTRHGVLPDVFIGAHAAVKRWPVLTRTTGRYQGYFPTIALVSPP